MQIGTPLFPYAEVLQESGTVFNRVAFSIFEDPSYVIRSQHVFLAVQLRVRRKKSDYLFRRKLRFKTFVDLATLMVRDALVPWRREKLNLTQMRKDVIFVIGTPGSGHPELHAVFVERRRVNYFPRTVAFAVDALLVWLSALVWRDVLSAGHCDCSRMRVCPDDVDRET